jgi:hypothetical protein
MIRRFPAPLITANILRGTDGDNINGPSLIRAPDWLPGRLGNYYLYFAHHHGSYIRLAVADQMEGPWRIHEPGTLQLHDAPGDMDHIASPDLHVDHENRLIRMYYHGHQRGETLQFSYVASSPDGVAFTSDLLPVGDFYLRMLPWRNQWIGMSKGGVMYCSPDGVRGFTRLPHPAFPMSDPQANAAGDVRHVALELRGDLLTVFFTRIGDNPEAILRAVIDLRRPRERWRARRERLLLRPETTWEGADLAPEPSRAGAASGRQHALRDPALFAEDGRRYLLYSIAGESGIGAAQLLDESASMLARFNPFRRRPRVSAPTATPGDPTKRIFVMGCARSGTWLLTALLSTFRDVENFPDETGVETFGTHAASRPVLVLKRGHRSYETIENIPHDIHIGWIVRHPFDVLTSYNPTTGLKYHVPPHRWLGEMLALQYLVETKRPNAIVIRYEDLVTRPDAVQREVAEAFGLEVEAGTDAIVNRFRPSEAADRAMHGLRPIDAASIDKFRRDPEKLAYLASIRPRLGGLLGWVAERYGYDVTL